MTEATLLYLEPDDEITAVVRRLRDAEAGRIVLVAPGRSKATSSAVALRLLAALAADEGRDVAVVGDALTRSLASEAGLAAYGSVNDARSATPAAAAEPRRASIHVVRGEDPTVLTAATSATALAPRAAPGDETRAVPITLAPRPAADARRRPRSRRRALPIAALLALAALLLGAAAAGALLLPAASIVITPETAPVGPIDYELRFDDPQRITGSVEETQEAAATGTYQDLVAATGQATFRNFNIVPIQVPAGTLVAAGEQAFETGQTVTVPQGALTGDGRIEAGEETVGIVAAAAGPAANVPAEAIDEILSQSTAAGLRGFPNNNARLVINYGPTAGGLEASGPVIEQDDVDAAAAALRDTLAASVAAELAAADGSLFADPAEVPEPQIEIPEDLVGTRDQAEFTLEGALGYDRAAVDANEVEAEARAELLADAARIPAGHALLPDTIDVRVGSPRREEGTLVIPVAVSARSSASVDPDGIAERVAGMPLDAAHDELAALGAVRIETWPGWVGEVPTLGWRVDVRVHDPTTPLPSGSPAT